MRGIIFFAFIAILISGCGKQIEEFVRDGGNGMGGDFDGPSTSPPKKKDKRDMKISPGANIVSGSQVKSRFTITPTERVVAGSQIKSVFSVNVSRPR
jgi:hypothetical protein